MKLIEIILGYASLKRIISAVKKKVHLGRTRNWSDFTLNGDAILGGRSDFCVIYYD